VYNNTALDELLNLSGHGVPLAVGVVISKLGVLNGNGDGLVIQTDIVAVIVLAGDVEGDDKLLALDLVVDSLSKVGPFGNLSAELGNIALIDERTDPLTLTSRAVGLNGGPVDFELPVGTHLVLKALKSGGVVLLLHLLESLLLAK